MIGVVVLGASGFAESMRSAALHVMGPQERFEAIDIAELDDADVVRAKLLEAVQRVDSGEGVLIATDMFGGVASNLAISVMARPLTETISGANLPLLVKLLKVRESMPLSDAAVAAQEAGRKYVTIASRVLGREPTPPKIGSSEPPIDPIARRLSENTSEILETARALSKEIGNQIGQLGASKPNDARKLKKHLDFISFLERVAACLDLLIDALEEAASLARGGVPEPALLSEASKVARRLKEIVVDGLERNADYIIDCSVRFGVFGAGFLFLRECGVDSYLSGILSGLMNLGVKRRGEKKKGGGNTKRK